MGAVGVGGGVADAETVAAVDGVAAVDLQATKLQLQTELKAAAAPAAVAALAVALRRQGRSLQSLMKHWGLQAATGRARCPRCAPKVG